MGLKQSMKQSMGMSMTPQLQMAIKILQMSVMELQQEITNALVENPTLEEDSPDFDDDNQAREQRDQDLRDSAEVKDPVQEMKDDFDWQAYLENSQQMSVPSTRNQGADDLPNFDQILSKPASLCDHLLKQLRMFTQDSKDLEIGEEIIGNLNDDGYLVVMVEEICARVNAEMDVVLKMLSQVQGFDPPGVAARDLRECLLIQCEVRHMGTIVRKIIESHLGELENKNYPVIAKALGLSMDEVVEASRQIHQLEPKPGRDYHTVEPHYITPDVYVVKRGAKFEVLLNEEGMPRLKVSQLYKAMLAENEFKGEAKKYLKEKMKDAAWLLKSLDQRQKTIFRVSEAIVTRQKDFFENGPSQLKPMILKYIADELGLHESTVSRVTNSKYMHTPFGIFELKYFFNSGLARSSGGGEDMASESVRMKIKEYVESEDPKKPLSDQDLAKLLADQNIKIARRTVAKYREFLNILPSNKRKKYF